MRASLPQNAGEPCATTTTTTRSSSGRTSASPSCWRRSNEEASGPRSSTPTPRESLWTIPRARRTPCPSHTSCPACSTVRCRTRAPLSHEPARPEPGRTPSSTTFDRGPLVLANDQWAVDAQRGPARPARAPRTRLPARGSQRPEREGRRGGWLPGDLGERALDLGLAGPARLERGQLDAGARRARVHGRLDLGADPGRRRHGLRQL